MSRDSRPTLRSRLALSYAAVALSGLVTLGVAVRLLDPVVLAARSPGPHPGGRTPLVSHGALLAALDWALIGALAVGLVVAVVVAHLATRSILRPLDTVRRTTRMLAAGQLHQRIDPPGERELAGLAEDVNHLAEALEATERQRSRLLGDLAHELRTPVTALRGLLEGALDGVLRADEALLGSALEETGRLERLAGDLAEVSRAEEGALGLELRDVDVGDLAVRASERLRPQFADKAVALDVVRRGQLHALADPDRIIQVLTNLLGNALRATSPGGAVTLDAAPDGSGVQVAVTDTGVGLTSDQLARVFDRFWRAPRSGGQGSGIGLTIARAIAEAHHGTLRASSPGPGKGATFVLTLPSPSLGRPPTGGAGAAWPDPGGKDGGGGQRPPQGASGAGSPASSRASTSTSSDG